MPSGSKPRPSDLTQEVAAILRGRMSRLGLAQGEVAARMGVSQSQLSKMLRGERHIDLDQFDQLCWLTECGMVDVLREADEGTNARPMARPLRGPGSTGAWKNGLSVVSDMTDWENEEGVAAEPRRPGEVIGDDGEFTF